MFEFFAIFKMVGRALYLKVKILQSLINFAGSCETCWIGGGVLINYLEYLIRENLIEMEIRRVLFTERLN